MDHFTLPPWARRDEPFFPCTLPPCARRDGRSFPIGQLHGDFAGQAPEHLLELPHAGLARVAADDLGDHLVRKLYLFRAQAGFLQPPRPQVAFRNLAFFIFAVTGQPNNFHPVEQGFGDRIQGIRSGDKEDL